MNISTISTKKDIKEFHLLPYIVNKNNKNWIPHIKQEVESVFNAEKNFFHQYGNPESSLGNEIIKMNRDNFVF